MARLEASRCRLPAAVLLLLLGQAAWAAAEPVSELELAGNLGVGVTDNIARTSANEREEGLASAGLQFAMLRETRRLSADVLGDLSYLRFLKGTFKDELVGNVRGTARVRVIENLLSFAVEDTFGQTRQDLNLVSSPVNSENVNFFSVGPEVDYEIASGFRLIGTARYSRVDYEVSAFGNESQSWTLGFRRDLSSSSGISLNASHLHVMPEAAAQAPDYDLDAAYLSYGITGVRMSLNINLGANKLRGHQLAEASGTLVGMTLSRRMGAYSVLSLELGRQQAYAGSLLSTAGEMLPVTAAGGNLTQTAEPFTSSYGRVSWEASGRVTSISLSASTRKEAYDSKLRNRRSSDATAMISRQVGPRARVRFALEHSRDKFYQVNADNDETLAELSVAWLVGRRVSLNASTEFYHFDSEGPSNGITDRRVWLRLAFGDTTVRSTRQRVQQ